MRGLNLKEIMFKSNMNQQGLNIATYRQAYPSQTNQNVTQSMLLNKLEIVLRIAAPAFNFMFVKISVVNCFARERRRSSTEGGILAIV